VEAAYPFMFADKLVFAAALISATAGGAVAGYFNARGMAYVPIMVAPFMSITLWDSFYQCLQL